MKKNINIYLMIILIISVIFITIGYAAYGEKLNITGNVSVLPPDKGVIITNVVKGKGKNIAKPGTFKYEKLTINHSNMIFKVSNSKPNNITYNVTITNKSNDNYIYNGFKLTPNIVIEANKPETTMNATVEGIKVGDKLAPSSSINIKVKYKLNLVDNNVTGINEIKTNQSIIFDLSNETRNSMKISLITKEVDLTTQNIVPVEFSVLSSYVVDRNFTISSSNKNFSIVDMNGNPFGDLTASNGNNNYKIYIKAIEGAQFVSEKESTSLVVTTPGLPNITSSNLSIIVKKNSTITDTLAPQIGPVTLEQAAELGKVRVSWSRTDIGGTEVLNYTILIYDSNNTLKDTITVDGNTYSYTTTSQNIELPTGSYYVIVYGTDAANNSGKDKVATATIDTPDARKSNIVAMQWIYNIKRVLTGLSLSGPNTVNKGENFTGVLTVTNNNYTLPETITVNMGQTPLGTSNTEKSYYTYNVQTGDLNIYNVQGDIEVVADGGCLVEGTMITLANGTKKKIEDINYDDLLLVWDYEHGKFIYQFPTWIEKEGVSNSYRLITFSDGSTLKTVSYHGIFSLDKNEFVSVNNKKDFKVGTRVIKTVQNGNKYSFKEVSVKDIKIVYEKVSFYHIITNVYYNVISDDYMTTDGNTIIQNIYNFDNNFKWKKDRKEILKNKNNLFDYSDFSSLIPYHLFKGLRIDEIKYIALNGGFSLNDFSKYLNQLADMNNRLMVPIKTDEQGNIYWNVTTSDNINKKAKVINNGIYILPRPKKESNFLGWYNTFDGKIYKPYDKLLITNSIYLEALYK